MDGLNQPASLKYWSIFLDFGVIERQKDFIGFVLDDRRLALDEEDKYKILSSETF